MSIDTLNAYCGHWLVQCPCLAQGRLYIPPFFFSSFEDKKKALGFFLPHSLFFKVTGGVALRFVCPGPDLKVAFLSGLTLWKMHFFPRDSPVCHSLSKLSGVWDLIFSFFFFLKRRKVEKLYKLIFRPESRQGDPPNLSILISGGKENNCDALSNGE
jgi:hypothetical protein